MKPFQTLRETTAPLLQQLDELRRAAGRLKTEAKKAYAQAAAEMDKAARRMGLPPREEPVIDVGARPGAVSRALRASASALAVALTASALLSLLLFCVQLFAAFLIVTRGLGLRVDVARPAA